MAKLNKRSKNKGLGRQFVHLTLDERIKIEVEYQGGRKFREIAKILGNGRSASSICREINGQPRSGIGKYQAFVSHEKAYAKREKRGKRPRLKNNLIRTYVTEKLKLGWSPEQVSLRLPIDHQGQEISYEAIYQYIYAQIHRGGNGKIREGGEDLRAFLPRRQKRRLTKGARKGQKTERPILPSIEDRPREVDKRQEIGHWEDDTMVSRKSTGRFKTINERVSGLVFIEKMKNGSVEESNRAVLEKLKTVPFPYRLTLTRDRGTENYGYKELEEILDLNCYFAHPYSSYERGSNENVNGLIRRYFPKGTDLAKITDKEVAHVEYLLNTRPRKRLEGLTPFEVFFNETGVALKC
jgi:IS30 family transposase